MNTRVSDGAIDRGAFRHEAFLYGDDTEFLRGTTEFIADGLDADVPVLVMVGVDRIRALKSELGHDAARVYFCDMHAIGGNPARIIPAWSDFASAHDGRPIRGIGEPVWSGRGPAEMIEAQCHELLLNLAFAGRSDVQFLCPYDTGRLDSRALGHARASHPLIEDCDGAHANKEFSCDDVATSVLTSELCPAPADADVLGFTVEQLRVVRDHVTRHTRRYGLDPQRAASFVLAVDEVATNSLRYGGGAGAVRCWVHDALVCEIRDEGRIVDPLVGRVRPAPGEVGGRGLWIANQVCDLVQIRSDETGTTVRLHVRRH